MAPAPADPALERERLAFEMKRCEAEQVERRLQRQEAKQKWEAEQQRHEAEQEERRLQK